MAHAEGRRPAAQRVHDLAQLVEGADGGLPAVRDGDAADRPVLR